AELETVRKLAAEATAELRSIVVGLRPADLNSDGVHLALRKQVELLDRVHGPQVSFVGEPICRLDAKREEAVYRVAQEALHNALRHAAAAHIEVGLGTRDGTLRLTVTDDGKGFDDAQAAKSARRLGISSMRERARSVGGRLSVRSSPGGGTAVTLEVPCGEV